MDRSRRFTWATRPSARVLLLCAVVAAAYVVVAQTGFAFELASASLPTRTTDEVTGTG